MADGDDAPAAKFTFVPLRTSPDGSVRAFCADLFVHPAFAELTDDERTFHNVQKGAAIRYTDGLRLVDLKRNAHPDAIFNMIYFARRTRNVASYKALMQFVLCNMHCQISLQVASELEDARLPPPPPLETKIVPPGMRRTVVLVLPPGVPESALVLSSEGRLSEYALFLFGRWLCGDGDTRRHLDEFLDDTSKQLLLRAKQIMLRGWAENEDVVLTAPAPAAPEHTSAAQAKMDDDDRASTSSLSSEEDDSDMASSDDDDDDDETDTASTAAAATTSTVEE